jgi:integrase/recombinase XerD
MATINLILDTRRENKANTYPLVFRIYSSGKTRDLPTGIKIQENKFNSKTEEIIGDKILNNTLHTLKLEYLQKLNVYKLKNRGVENAQDIKTFLQGKLSHEYTIYSFWEEQIVTLNNMGRNGTARSYKIALSSISKNINLHISFEKLTYKSLVELETSLYMKGMTTNGISVYLRTLKAIYNKAINLDIVGYEHYPFRKFKIKKASTTPRVLSTHELKSYFNLRLDKSSLYYKSWLIGKLIFMIRGINSKDLLMLNHKNIKNGRIIYRRAKTKKIYSIPLLPEISEVLNEFTPNETSILGTINESEIKDPSAFIEIMSQKRKVLNAHLKKIGVMIGSNEPITTYVFRYSFSNLAKQLGYSKDLISEALGHNYGNSTTSHYLEQFHQDELDELTMKVIKVVVKDKDSHN